MYRVLSIDLANSWLGGGDGGPFATQVDTVPDDPQFLRGVDVEVIEGAARNILARASSLAADPAKVAASLYAANLATKLDSERSLKKIQGAVLQRLASAEDLFSLFLGATLSRRLP